MYFLYLLKYCQAMVNEIFLFFPLSVFSSDRIENTGFIKVF
jgi:hypothetical protein